ncbi:MAG: SDR family oxidoreductase [Flavobacteriaceae bacterium]|nr:SDR family oxidoreductase [Flavobacteriaceae bacterium]
MDFEQKIIWITGASSGIGKALALALSGLGARLIVSSRNENALNAVRSLCKYPEKVKLLPLDLAEYDHFDTLIPQAISLFGSIDMLINNGGISQRSYAVDTDIATDKRLFDVNFFGTVALTKALLPYFIERKAGHIVVVSSVVGKIGTPKRSSYAASKHALHGFFDSLRAEVYEDNIAVTIICPGYVHTDISKNALMGDGSPQNKMDQATARGLPPEVFARKMLKAIAAGKREVIISGAKERLAVYLKRFFPSLLAKTIRKVNVT